jgi:NADPH oxidase
MIVSWRKFFLLLAFWGLCAIVGLSGFLFTYLDVSIFPNSTALHLGVSVAKTGAALIKFSSALLLLSMSRAVMTRVSRTRVGKYFSVGWMIPIHRGAGIVFIVGTLLHCVAHLANVVLLSQHRNVQWAHPTLLTGLALLIIYITIAVTSFVGRIKRYSFELFYYLHYAAPLSMILLYLHGIFCFLKNSESQCTGSTTLYWITIPIAVYLLDQAMSLWRGSRFAYISKVIVHPSNVIEVQIRRPDFVFLPGQYVYVKCPAVSWLQWHPFTLTSAPEEDHLSMHIRLVGSWTEKLWKLLQHSALEGIKVYVDGPYGCASQDHGKFSSIICIGAGIGQTPFASIMKSLWYTLGPGLISRFRLNKPIGGHQFRSIHFVGICRNTKVTIRQMFNCSLLNGSMTL